MLDKERHYMGNAYADCNGYIGNAYGHVYIILNITMSIHRDVETTVGFSGGSAHWQLTILAAGGDEEFRQWKSGAPDFLVAADVYSDLQNQIGSRVKGKVDIVVPDGVVAILCVHGRSKPPVVVFGVVVDPCHCVGPYSVQTMG